MKIQALSDLARSMLSQSQANRLKTEQTQLSTELTTGQSADLVRHLNSDLILLADVTNRNAMIEQFQLSNREIVQSVDLMQVGLSSLRDASVDFIDAAIVIPQSNVIKSTELLGTEARGFFDKIVTVLNSEVSGKHLFSGNASDTKPLPSSDELKSMISTALAGATTVADIQSELDTFFGPAGDFETLAYGGSVDPTSSKRINEDTSINVDVKANDDVFRNLLKSAALAMAAADFSSLSRDQRNMLVEESRNLALSAKDEVAVVSGQVGFSQEKLEQTQTQIETQLTATNLVRAELMAVDPFETASRLEDINLRLELLYTATARSRNLSFLEFMR